MHRVVRAHAVAYGIGEDRTEQPDGARCSTLAAGHPRETALPRLGTRRGFAVGDGVHEALDILALDSSNRHAAEYRLDVPLDAALIGGERGGLFRLTARQKPAGLGVGEIGVAQLGNRLCLARGALHGRRVCALHNLAEDAPRLPSRRLGRPRRAVPADRGPALPALGRAVKHAVAHGLALLAPREEAG